MPVGSASQLRAYSVYDTEESSPYIEAIWNQSPKKKEKMKVSLWNGVNVNH